MQINKENYERKNTTDNKQRKIINKQRMKKGQKETGQKRRKKNKSVE